MKMTKIALLIILIFTILPSVFAQNMQNYQGNWQTEINEKNPFQILIRLEKNKEANYTIQLKNDSFSLDKNVVYDSENQSIHCQLSKNLSLQGYFAEDKKSFRGFITSGILNYQIYLEKSKSDSYEGKWNILMLDELLSKNLYLSIENAEGEEYEAYPIFGDTRFTGTWCANFQKKEDKIIFQDMKTGLAFEGILQEKQINLSILIAGKVIFKTVFMPSNEEWKIGKLSSDKNQDKGNYSNSLDLSILEDSIKNNIFPNTHSILVSKNGKLCYENYFKGHNQNLAHDQRSASKSISSALLGIAIDKNIISNEESLLMEVLPNSNKIYFEDDSLKSKIRLHDLLTMSSGLDAIDSERNSVAAENNYQSTPNWEKTVLSAEMKYAPRLHSNYGSANPYLLGLVLNYQIKEKTEEDLLIFMDKFLFKELDIKNYVVQNDIIQKPYLGGGMYLKSLDMLKFGELYLKKGAYKDKQIISQQWIEKSLQNHTFLENAPQKNEYGYLWWHHKYSFKDQIIKTLEARGNGGQYIILVPSLDVVVVITSGNYNSNKSQQPEQIFEKYILPLLLK
jgi:CubicO group peptidase (beta-lactamase class C family)